MTINQRNQFLAEMTNYLQKERWISFCAQSSTWGNNSDIKANAAELEELWDAAERTVKDIASTVGMSARKLAERFFIPYRTMEDWCAGKRQAPIYVHLMMQEALGLLTPPEM